MDIDYFEDGSHRGSGLGSTDNGPVPVPQSPGAAQYDASGGQFGTPIESNTRIDGLADSGFDDNGADQIEDEAEASPPSADSISQPDRGQGSPTGTNYPH